MGGVHITSPTPVNWNSNSPSPLGLSLWGQSASLASPHWLTNPVTQQLCSVQGRTQDLVMYNLRGGASLHSTGLKELSAAGQSIRFNWWSIGLSQWFWVKVGDSAVHASSLDPQRLVVCNTWPWILNSLGTTERAEQSSKVLQSPNYNKIKLLFFLQEAIACCRRSFSSYFEDSELTFTAGFSVLQSLSDSDPSKDPYHFFELLGNSTSVHGPGPDYHHSLPYCGNVYSRYLSLQGVEQRVTKCYCLFLGM